MDHSGGFASLLEEMIGEAADRVDYGSRAAPAVNYLAAVAPLHGGGSAVSPREVETSYREMSLADEFVALIDERAERLIVEDPPSLVPERIAEELELAECDLAGLARARRAFASRNHPDRVAPHLREIALQRMQIANALIDQARNGKAATGR